MTEPYLNSTENDNQQSIELNHAMVIHIQDKLKAYSNLIEELKSDLQKQKLAKKAYREQLKEMHDSVVFNIPELKSESKQDKKNNIKPTSKLEKLKMIPYDDDLHLNVHLPVPITSTD